MSRFKKGEKNDFNPPLDISVNFSSCNPSDCEEQVNSYGTYNIQPTADTENEFPAISQGESKKMKKRSLKFFRSPKDSNPAGISEKD